MKIKFTLTAMFALLCLNIQIANAQSFKWSVKMNSSNANSADVSAASIAVNQSGKLLIAGKDNGYGGTQSLFVRKYDSSGVSSPIWESTGLLAGNIGEGYFDSRDLALDQQGNIFMGGFYQNFLRFGTDTLKASNWNMIDFFITKFTPNGQYLWSRKGASNYNMSLTSIAKGDSSSVLVAGTAQWVIYIGSDTLPGGVFLAKYDASGNYLWSKSVVSTTTTLYPYIASDDNGNTFLLRGKILSEGDYGFKLVKYDMNGNIVDSAQGVSGMGANSFPKCITRDESGNIYAAGEFSGNLIVNNDTLTAQNSSDLFLIKYDSSLGYQWSKRYAGKNLTAISLTTGPNRELALCGSFNDTMKIAGDTLVGSGYNDDIFIIIYDSASVVTQTHRITGLSSGTLTKFSGSDIAFDGVGNLYITGTFEGKIVFDGAKPIEQWSPTVSRGFIARIESYSSSASAVFDQTPDTKYTIYPNPNNGNFNLKISKFENLKMVKIQIYNVLGDVVFSKQPSTNNEQLSTNLTSGIYFIQVSNENNIISNQKIIIQ